MSRKSNKTPKRKTPSYEISGFKVLEKNVVRLDLYCAEDLSNTEYSNTDSITFVCNKGDTSSPEILSIEDVIQLALYLKEKPKEYHRILTRRCDNLHVTKEKDGTPCLTYSFLDDCKNYSKIKLLALPDTTCLIVNHKPASALSQAFNTREEEDCETLYKWMRGIDLSPVFPGLVNHNVHHYDT